MKRAPLLSAAAIVATVLVAGVALAQQRKPPPPPPEPEKADKADKAEKPADCGTLPKDWSGEAYALDGATLGGVGLKPHIRLWGLQTGELRDRQSGLETPSGMQARAALEDMLEKAEHKVKCRPARWDRECRLVAQCLVETSPSAIDLGGYMLASGVAYGFHLDEALPWEPRASQRYAGAEAEARKARRGLWPVWLGEK